MASIGDHALIGDSRSAALVARDGSIDWLCWPRFDSPSIFGGLLDAERGGRWRIAPTGPAYVTRRYLPDTNVLETTFRAQAGTLLVTDCMPVASEAAKRSLLLPQHEIVRCVRVTEGEIDLEVEFDPRPDYGRGVVRARDRRGLGLWFRMPGGAELILRTDAPPLDRKLHLRAGDRLHFSLSYSEEAPAVVPPVGRHTWEAVERTIAWWREFAGMARYRGPHRDAVVRSALALKLLGYAPSGAIVAAPTTSLPERIGGGLNWDYRFCWLRDAVFTARALYGLGYEDDAESFVIWLLHTTGLTHPELRVLYDVYGRLPPPERVLDHLEGFAGSRPIRVGNAAARQRQLDVYGEVIDAAWQMVQRAPGLTRETDRMLRRLGDFVCEHWFEPDAGIWESRGPLRHHTHSRALCWVALDRLLEMVRLGHLAGAPAARWSEVRARIRRDIEERGWSERRQSYARWLGSDELDLSVLLLARYGFARADSPRMRSTWRALSESLHAGDGLFYRYENGEFGSEGAFLVCSFWACEFLALGGGTLEEATALYRRLLGYTNDVGLLGEEVDPSTGGPLGNFPQAYSHLGVINVAMTLEERADELRRMAALGVRGDGRLDDDHGGEPGDRLDANERALSPGHDGDPRS